MYDFTNYMSQLTGQNNMARAWQFEHTTCSGLGYLEGMIEQYQSTANFVCTSDVCQESLYAQSGGWFKRRVYTVFIIARYEYGNQADYAVKMDRCRELARQFTARMLHDSLQLQTEMLYLDTDNIKCSELGGIFLNGCTGLYLMVGMDEPTDLTYNPDLWADNTTSHEPQQQP